MADTTYVARGPLCWGKSTTPDKAIKAMKENLPSRSYLGKSTATYTVHKIVGEFLGVGDMHGEINYRGTIEKVGEGTARLR